jgi:sulfatase maturation enzyme AslB (radical SAM superfamily)
MYICDFAFLSDSFQLLKQSATHLPTFNQKINEQLPHFHPLRRQTAQEGGTTTLQINIGKRCNLICKHCHVESGPTRTENMERKTAERLVHLIKNSSNVHTVDLTGGAPELNENFKYIVKESRAAKKNVIDRYFHVVGFF